MTQLILHAANYDHQVPEGSLSGLEMSLKAQISRIEVDIIPMIDGDFALLHDPRLERLSDASGDVTEHTGDFVKGLKYKGTEFYLGTLSQAIELLKKYPLDGFLQLDLKPYAPLTPTSLCNLVKWIRPMEQSIMVSSVADWAIRFLRKIAPDLSLGFDPLLYLDVVAEEPREEGIPPFRVSAYGYLDDHPLAVQRWGQLGEYFATRAEALLMQVPQGITWFLNAQLLDEVMLAGFDWINYLHAAGNTVDAWTLDLDRSELALRMKKSGVDFITTNQWPEMLAQLNQPSD